MFSLIDIEYQIARFDKPAVIRHCVVLFHCSDVIWCLERVLAFVIPAIEITDCMITDRGINRALMGATKGSAQQPIQPIYICTVLGSFNWLPVDPGGWVHLIHILSNLQG